MRPSSSLMELAIASHHVSIRSDLVVPQVELRPDWDRLQRDPRTNQIHTLLRWPRRRRREGRVGAVVRGVQNLGQPQATCEGAHKAQPFAVEGSYLRPLALAVVSEGGGPFAVEDVGDDTLLSPAPEVGSEAMRGVTKVSQSAR